MGSADQIIRRTAAFRDEAGKLTFGYPVTHVYHPLDYAWEPHKLYLEKYASGKKRIVFLGMNPGPWGMAQTGVPFGDLEQVTGWLRIQAPVSRPDSEHPRRRVEGFDCPRSEVSGQRLWGLLADRFTTPEAFFRDHFVANYCPLVFLEESGRNRTPDRLPKKEQDPLTALCDAYLRDSMAILNPEWVVGIGNFSHAQAVRALKDTGIRVGRVLHPSPASPAANRGWAAAAVRQLTEQGIWPDT
jgi:single-strand selective monofunctional uracil DNA glycosylase